MPFREQFHPISNQTYSTEISASFEHGIRPLNVSLPILQDEDLVREGDGPSRVTAVATMPWKAMELIQNARVRIPTSVPEEKASVLLHHLQGLVSMCSRLG